MIEKPPILPCKVSIKPRHKFLLLGFLIFSLYAFQCEYSNGFIRLEYLGDVSKPYPLITFYLEGSIDSTYEKFYIYKILVTRKEFKSVRKKIENNSNDSSLNILPDPVEFTFVENGKKHLLYSRDKETIRKVFFNIYMEFKDTPKAALVKSPLNNLLGRLGIELIEDSNIINQKRERIRKN